MTYLEVSGSTFTLRETRELFCDFTSTEENDKPKSSDILSYHSCQDLCEYGKVPLEVGTTAKELFLTSTTDS